MYTRRPEVFRFDCEPPEHIKLLDRFKHLFDVTLETSIRYQGLGAYEPCAIWQYKFGGRFEVLVWGEFELDRADAPIPEHPPDDLAWANLWFIFYHKDEAALFRSSID